MSDAARRPLLLLATVALALSVGALVACGSNSSAKKSSTATHPLADGATIGKIERSAGGTAVVTNVRSLLALSCREGEVTLRTNLEALIGSMDCSHMITQSIADRFLGQPVVVTYGGGNLQLENPTAGTIVLPGVSNLSVTDLSAPP